MWNGYKGPPPRYLVERLLTSMATCNAHCRRTPTARSRGPGESRAFGQLAGRSPAETAARYTGQPGAEGIEPTEPRRRPIDRVLTHRPLGIAHLRAGHVHGVSPGSLGPPCRPSSRASSLLAHGSSANGGRGPSEPAGRRSHQRSGGVFLPQILILFAFIAILEDCGYMARAAYLMDWFMARIGLNGKSSSPCFPFACAIWGSWLLKIANERDRLTTILAALLMTCSARLPVYALLIAAFPRVLFRRPAEPSDSPWQPSMPWNPDGVVWPWCSDDLSRRHASVSHGTAQLQVAVASKRSTGSSSGRSCSLCGNADPCRLDPGLGRPYYPHAKP